MAKVMWKITKDFLIPNEEGYIEPTKDKFDVVDVQSVHYDGDDSTLIYTFRLFDDDRNISYEGICNSNETFSPLTNYGAPNAGCTYIQYKNSKGKWETL